MAIEEIANSPDADPVAVFSFGDERHILLKRGFRRWNRGAALALQ